MSTEPKSPFTFLSADGGSNSNSNDTVTTMSVKNVAPLPTPDPVENWKGAVDPTTCKPGYYSLSLTLTSAGIGDGEPCLGTTEQAAAAAAAVKFTIGTTQQTSFEGVGQYPTYLATYHLGCQNPEDPLQIVLVNDLTGQQCLVSSLDGWSEGRNSVVAENGIENKQTALSLSTGTMQSYPFTLSNDNGATTVDMTIIAYPGPPVIKQTWNQHTPGDISAIVIGMMIFLAAIVGFMWRVKNGSAGPPPSRTAAGPTAAPKTQRGAEASAPPHDKLAKGDVADSA